MKPEIVINHMKNLEPGEEDVLLIEGEPFYVRKATAEDLEAVKESVKNREER